MRRMPVRNSFRQPGEYQRTLLEKREEILSNLGVKFDGLASMGRVAEEDQVAISHEEFISLQRNSMDYSRLRLINEALDRLKTGDYGTCGACEEPISARRLEALPWARYCIDCQNRLAEHPEESPEPAGVSWPG
jgi:DnaK suppressor protein